MSSLTKIFFYYDHIKSKKVLLKLFITNRLNSIAILKLKRTKSAKYKSVRNKFTKLKN